MSGVTVWVHESGAHIPYQFQTQALNDCELFAAWGKPVVGARAGLALRSRGVRAQSAELGKDIWVPLTGEGETYTGLSESTLRRDAQRGLLAAWGGGRGHPWMTTRRNLDEYMRRR